MCINIRICRSDNSCCFFVSKNLCSFYILQVALKALGFEMKKVEVLKILRDYDKNNSGKIEFEGFNEVGEIFKK